VVRVAANPYALMVRMDTRVKPAYDEPEDVMVKSKKPKPRKTKQAEPPAERTPLAPDARIMSSNLTLHQLFAQQTSAMLARADLTEEQKQSLLIGISCPCCGGGGFSFTAKLKR
jgi:hypothetical protein